MAGVETAVLLERRRVERQVLLRHDRRGFEARCAIVAAGGVAPGGGPRTQPKGDTKQVFIAACLGDMAWNAEVESTDERPQHLLRIYGWRCPRAHAEVATIAGDRILKALSNDVERLRSSLEIKSAFNPGVDIVRETLRNLVTAARDASDATVRQRVVFFYCGHGMQRADSNAVYFPSPKGRNAAPLQLTDLLHYAGGAPHVLVLDCASAGAVQARIVHDMSQRTAHHRGAQPVAPSVEFFFGCCAKNEVLPSHPLLPNDIYTSCLTTPIKMSLLWFVVQHRVHYDLPLSLIHALPNSEDRTSELFKVFVAIVECIGVTAVGGDEAVFHRLFREDPTCLYLWRHHLLAERIITRLGCTPCTYPVLLPTATHPLWATWDGVLDSSVAALARALRPTPAKGIPTNQARFQLDAVFGSKATVSDKPRISFFDDELRTMGLCLEGCAATDENLVVSRLPVLFFALLAQAHRHAALGIAARFVDRGPWALRECHRFRLHADVFNKLWAAKAKEYRPPLLFIAAKSASVDDQLLARACHPAACACAVDVLTSPAPTEDARLGAYGTANGQRLLAACVLCFVLLKSPDQVATCVRAGVHTCLAELILTTGGIDAIPDDATDDETVRYRLRAVVPALAALLLFGSEHESVDVVRATCRGVATLLASHDIFTRVAALRYIHAVLARPAASEAHDFCATVLLEHARREASSDARREAIAALRCYCTNRLGDLEVPLPPQPSNQSHVTPSGFSASGEIPSMPQSSVVGITAQSPFLSYANSSGNNVEPMELPSQATTSGDDLAGNNSSSISSVALPVRVLETIAGLAVDIDPAVRVLAAKLLAQLARDRHMAAAAADAHRAALPHIRRGVGRSAAGMHTHHGGGSSGVALSSGEGLDASIDYDWEHVNVPAVNESDPDTVADAVLGALDFLHAPLLDLAARSGQNTVNTASSHRSGSALASAHHPHGPLEASIREDKVEAYLHVAASNLTATLLTEVRAPILRCAYENIDARTAAFHPAAPYVVCSAVEEDAVFVLGTAENRMFSSFAPQRLTGYDLIDPAAPMAHGSGSTPSTPRTPGRVGHAHVLPTTVTSLEIIDPAIAPMLVTVAASGAVTVVGGFLSQPHRVTAFPTLPREYSVHSTSCLACFQQPAHTLHVSGWRTAVSSWDLERAIAIDERTDAPRGASSVSALAASLSNPFGYLVGYSDDGSVSIVDTRSQSAQAAHLRPMRSTCLSIAPAKTAPHVFTTVSALGVVRTWDDRKLAAELAKFTLDGFGEVARPGAKPAAGAPKSDLVGLPWLSAVDVHACSLKRPLVVGGSAGRVKVHSKELTLASLPVSRGAAGSTVTVSRWHPTRVQCLVSVSGGGRSNVAVFAQPDGAADAELFDF